MTERVKAKIEELKPGLPEGVRIVPAYDRTRLIQRCHPYAHECHVARDGRSPSLAILLILTHVRSAFVICITLPLSVLFSFALMWVLRKAGIIDIQANIMSLAGITISVGVLVDQAIVMVENATHHLREKFGRDKVTGDTRELLFPRLPHCRPADLFLCNDHAAVVRTGVPPLGPCRQALSSAGVHKEFCACSARR